MFCLLLKSPKAAGLSEYLGGVWCLLSAGNSGIEGSIGECGASRKDPACPEFDVDGGRAMLAGWRRESDDHESDSSSRSRLCLYPALSPRAVAPRASSSVFNAV